MTPAAHTARRCTAAWMREQITAEYGHVVRIRTCVAGHDVLEVEALAEAPPDPRTLPRDYGATEVYLRTCERCQAQYETRRQWSRWCEGCRVLHHREEQAAMRAQERAARPGCRQCGAPRVCRSPYCERCRSLPYCPKCAKRVATDHRCPWRLAPAVLRRAKAVRLVPSVARQVAPTVPMRRKA